MELLFQEKLILRNEISFCDFHNTTWMCYSNSDTNILGLLTTYDTVQHNTLDYKTVIDAEGVEKNWL